MVLANNAERNSPHLEHFSRPAKPCTDLNAGEVDYVREPGYGLSEV